MNPRTYEGPMDWEYQGSGPRDPTSPFTHAAQSSKGFGTSPLISKTKQQRHAEAVPISGRPKTGKQQRSMKISTNDF